MPPLRLVFEGPTPESVILEACSEHGPQVQLTEPERIRHGGMLGFFAQNAYRVRVMPREHASAGAMTGHVALGGAPSDASAPARPAPGPRVTADTATGTSSASSALETLLDASPDVDVDLDGPPPKNFDEALERAAAALGPEQAPSKAAPDAFEALIARLREQEMPTPLFETTPSGGTELPETAPLEASAPSAAVFLSEAGRPEPTLDPDVFGQDLLGSDLAATDLWRAPEPEVRRFAIPSHDIAPQGARNDAARVVAALRSVAFPTQLLAAAAGRLPAGFDLEQVFATLPAPRQLPSVSGALIAVVGPEPRALEHARRIASELGLDPAEVALARTSKVEGGASRRPRGLRAAEEAAIDEAEERGALTPVSSLAPDLYVEEPEQASALSPGWRRDRVGIVAVEIGNLLDASPRARSMLRALRPSVTLILAEGTQKAADIAFRANALGGADALLIDNLQATMTPCELLTADIPIARLGGEPATPAAWVRLVEATLDRRASGEAS